MRAHVINMHATCTSELEIFILVAEVLCDDAPNIRRSCGEVVISSRFNGISLLILCVWVIIIFYWHPHVKFPM